MNGMGGSESTAGKEPRFFRTVEPPFASSIEDVVSRVRTRNIC